MVKTDRHRTDLAGMLLDLVVVTHEATARTFLKGPRSRCGRRFVVTVMTTALLTVWETLSMKVVMTFESVVGTIIYNVARCPAVLSVQVLLCSLFGMVVTVLLESDVTAGTTTTFTMTLVESVPNILTSGKTGPSMTRAMNLRVKKLNMMAGTFVRILRAGPSIP